MDEEISVEIVPTRTNESISKNGLKKPFKQIEINHYTDETENKIVVCPHITLFGVQETPEGSGFNQYVMRVGCKVCKKKYGFKLETWY